jgi:hypothetical protein
VVRAVGRVPERTWHGACFQGVTADWPTILFVSLSLLAIEEVYLLADSTDRATVGLNIVTMALLLTPAKLSPVVHAMFSVPNLALENAMACRVFRKLKLGLMHEGIVHSSTSGHSGGKLPQQTFRHIRVGRRANQGLGGDRESMELEAVIPSFHASGGRSQGVISPKLGVTVTHDVKVHDVESLSSDKKAGHSIV